ncbi:unnamed protein product [Vicia faba]|uniref:RRM domain-containing protein n=1 Tax=Vicia faba TaxID=3906 RepID=A0AAV1A2C9_VICFA|nr:unnamed protein product [Vicia faba]
MDSDQGKLFIGGISWDTNEEKLKEHFGNYGDVLNTSVMREKNTGKPRGFGFVVFSDPSVLDRVLEDKHVIDGRTVDAKRAFSREDQPISVTSRTGNSNSGLSSEYWTTTRIWVKRALPKDANPGASSRMMGGAGGGSGGMGGYQGYGASGGNQNAYDGRSDSSRYMQPQSAAGGFPTYGSSAYSAAGYGYGSASNGLGYGAAYGGYGGATAGYGGPAAATYGNPNVPNAAYAGGGPRSSWPAQAPSGYGSMGYGNTAPWGAPSGGAGSGSATAGQSPSGAAGYGNQGYGYGGYGGGYGASDSSYGNPGVYGAVGGRTGSAPSSNASGQSGSELQGSGGSGNYMGSGYGDANGNSGYGNAAWRSEQAQASGNYGTPQGNGGQVGYGGGYGGAQTRQAQQQ